MTLNSVQLFAPYRTDPLFLLIGTNPLPNYVAACLLAPENGTIYLLHSEDTFEVADRLARRLSRVRPSATLIPRQIDESDGDKIIAKIEEMTAKLGRGMRIGLNYSGGTKAMAVHAYYALRKAFPDGCFSYLDPRKLAMVIDPGDKPVQTLPVSREVEVKLADLLQMHGYKFAEFRRQPRWPDLCAAIAEVFTAPESRAQWLGWLRTWRAQPPAPTLPDLAVYRDLEPVIHALSGLCGGMLSEAAVAQAMGFSAFSSCQEFFEGKWLEEYALAQLVKVAADVGVHDYGVGINIRRKDKRRFELDLLAMMGYQLYAISCMATAERDPAEYHLHEVFVRARQVGGDEARFALICAYDRPKALEQEVSEDWDAEKKIKVFGQDDLLSLPDKLRRWFETANP